MSACGWSSFQIPDSGPESTNVRFGSMYETAGSFPALQSAKNCDWRLRDRLVLVVPEEQEADVAAVVAGAHVLRREPVPDRRQVDARERVVEPVGDAGVDVDPVRERRAEDRREVAVAHRPRRRGLAEERQILLAVVADGEEVAAGREQPAVAGAVVPLDACALVGVVRIGVRAALEVGRERIRLVRDAVRVEIRQPRLLAVGSRQPAGEMVERAVLHHHDDDVVDPGLSRLRQRHRSRCRRAGERAERAGACERARGGRGGRDEAAPRERPFPPGGHGRDDSPSRG